MNIPFDERIIFVGQIRCASSSVMFLRLVHTVIFFMLSIIVSALDFDSTGPFENELLFSDTASATSLDQKAPSMFDLTELPFDSPSEVFLDENIGDSDINFQSPSSQNDDNISLLSLFSEPAHFDEEDSNLNELTPGYLIAAVDSTTFLSDAGADAGSGEIADLSDIDQVLLRGPFRVLNPYQAEINPFCSLYTKTYNPVGVCASNKAEYRVELPQLLPGSSPVPFRGYTRWNVDHATYGKLICSNRNLS